MPAGRRRLEAEAVGRSRLAAVAPSGSRPRTVEINWFASLRKHCAVLRDLCTGMMPIGYAAWLPPRADRVERHPCISVFDLRRIGVIQQHRDMAGAAPNEILPVWSIYTASSNQLVLVVDNLCDTRVSVEWSACRFGGARPWFACPVCQRRCGLLHLVADEWGCRKCHRLRYETQRLRSPERHLLAAQRARARLGQRSPYIGAPVVTRPPRMRRKTYAAAQRRIAHAEDIYLRSLG